MTEFLEEITVRTVTPKTVAFVIIAAMMTAPTCAFAESKAGSAPASGDVPSWGTPTMVDQAPTLVDDLQTIPSEEISAADETTASAPHDPNVTHCVRELSEDGNASTTDTETSAQESADECVQMVDAVPTMVAPDGSIVPLGEADGATAALVEQRLQERRLEIEGRAGEIEAKQAILDAAEKRVEERAAALDVMQKQIEASEAAVVEAAAEQIKNMIAVYEGMKPTSAAQIFDELPDSTLAALAKEMNPRKLAPILAKMNPARAGALTVLLGSQPQ